MKITPFDIILKAHENFETGYVFHDFNVHVKHYEYRLDSARARVRGNKGNVQMVVTSKKPHRFSYEKWEEKKNDFYWECFSAIKNEIPEPDFYVPSKVGGRMVYNEHPILNILVRPNVEVHEKKVEQTLFLNLYS